MGGTAREGLDLGDLRNRSFMKRVTALFLVVSASGLSMEDIVERLRALEPRNSVLEAKVEKSELPAGALLSFVDGRTVCPKGTIEANITQGMMLVGRPKNGKAGAAFNRAFDAGEIGRTPAHSHAVSVHDSGHNHVNMVNDPGHGHGDIMYLGQVSGGNVGGGPAASNWVKVPVAKTNITVDSQPAKSAIEVSIDTNDAGEHYPMVYVLLCQKLPGN